MISSGAADHDIALVNMKLKQKAAKELCDDKGDQIS